jgi:hypothetical protein
MPARSSSATSTSIPAFMQKAPLTPRQQLLPDYSVKTYKAGGISPPFLMAS